MVLSLCYRLVYHKNAIGETASCSMCFLSHVMTPPNTVLCIENGVCNFSVPVSVLENVSLCFTHTILYFPTHDARFISEFVIYFTIQVRSAVEML